MASERSRRTRRDWRNLADVVIEAEAAQRSPVRRVVAALTLAGMLLVANAAFVLSRGPQAPPLFSNLQQFESALRTAGREEPRPQRKSQHAAPSRRTHLIDHWQAPAAVGRVPF